MITFSLKGKLGEEQIIGFDEEKSKLQLVNSTSSESGPPPF